MSLYTDANGVHIDGDIVNSAGTVVADSSRGAAVADVAEADADATYGQAEADLINELKTQVNALLAILRTGKFPAAS